jgi:hypothetical protein
MEHDQLRQHGDAIADDHVLDRLDERHDLSQRPGLEGLVSAAGSAGAEGWITSPLLTRLQHDDLRLKSRARRAVARSSSRAVALKIR